VCWGAGHSFASCRGRRCHVRSCTDLSAGAPVAAYGHALYGNHWKQRRPSLSVGNLSKVVALHGRPAMLQSSAAVHGGNSGGMLLNPEGTVLGMVTSNVRHTPPPSSADDMATRKAKEKESEEGGALLVELNFSMPLVALEELLAMAGLFDDRSGLEGAVDSDGDDGKAAAATSAGRRRAVSDHEFMDLEMQAELDSPDEQVCAEIDYRSYGCGWRQWDRQKCRIVGKSQSVLIMINPIIFTRTRIRLCVQGLCLVRAQRRRLSQATHCVHCTSALSGSWRRCGPSTSSRSRSTRPRWSCLRVGPASKSSWRSFRRSRTQDSRRRRRRRRRRPLWLLRLPAGATRPWRCEGGPQLPARSGG
jgi:hypothetical protein